MSRRWVWCPVQQRVVEPHERIPQQIQRSPLPSPMVITDEVAPFRSMADGKIYSSKSRYYAETKARGYEIVGNEKVKGKTPDTFEPENIEQELSDAYDYLEAGNPVPKLKDTKPEQWND